ncbi:hypothetical protein [Chthonobacter rhizosphaerae]|uniref:hypothetical protein n=1 Tax=Chthonobacter rhizosphaerae TaxID=2735553 RepID=UPI0015EF51F4|nr:hypothetical protein [Chthonobacter rhizosphaerae]
MRQPFLLAGIAILITAMVVLVAFDDGGMVGGVASDDVASMAQLGALALVIGAGLFATRQGALVRFRQAMVWLAIGFVLVVGYLAYNGQL